MRHRGRTGRVIPTLLLLLCSAASIQAAAEKPAPRLVVVISVDQMRADYLDRFRPYFGKNGFNRFLERGAVFTRARHRHAITYTGPGHAAIGSGLDPRHTGIIGNFWYDLTARREVYCVEDRQSRLVGEGPKPPTIPVAPASSVLEDGASLGDRFKENLPGARVVGIALKDRAAVLMAGRKADAAIWFEEGFGRFVTSTYYRPIPSLLEFNRALPVFLSAPAHRQWTRTPRIPEADLARITFDPPELYDSKGQPDGYGPTFPHALADPKAIISSPWGDVLMLQLARHAIERLRLGAEPGHPDLLFIGLSSTDYYGHWFGPDSKEVADGIVRLDETLGRFLDWLEGRVGAGKALVFLTSDHGVQPLPEVVRARQKEKTGQADYYSAGRVDYSNSRGGVVDPTMKELGGDRFALEWHLSAKFAYEVNADAKNSAEGAIAYFQEPSFYLNRPVLARRGVPVEKAKEAVRDWVAKRPGVLEAFTNTEIADGLPPGTPHAEAIERSFRPDRSGDVFVVLKPGWIWSYGRETGTTHGQPNDDDTRVPLLAWGAGVKAGRYETPVSPLAVARTVGTLFGFQVGEPDVEPLAPVLGSRPPAERPAKRAASR